MMAALLGRTSRQALLKAPGANISQKANMSFKTLSRGKKIAVGMCVVTTAGGIGLGIALQNSVLAGDLILHHPKYPWYHKWGFNSIEHGSARRGYQVYKQVCAACHSMEYMRYRHLVGTIMSKAEAQAEAEEVMVEDGPDDEGKYYERPGKLSDSFPKPYPNEQAAALANNGADPPDLSLMTSAREGGEDYLFALLTGYHDAPAGVKVDENYYNPYFLGGIIAMPPPLYNEIIEYDDGTPATLSQMAKDIIVFLKLSSEPEHDYRKRLALKWLPIAFFFWAVVVYYKRHKWSVLKTRTLAYKPRSK